MSVDYMDLFYVLDTTTELLKQELDLSYIESLIYSAENLIDHGKVYNPEKKISAENIIELEKKYHSVELDKFHVEEIRKAMQLSLLKGIKEDYIQANHQMTPDSLGTLLAYLIELIADLDEQSNDELHIVDLSVGTGNLLLTIHHFLKNTLKRPMILSGIDNDDLMLSVASTNSALQNVPIHLQYQDALENLLLKPADIVVSDLPVGYYPLNERIDHYETSFKEDDEKSYSHYLLIEQAINYLKEDGYGFFLVPSNMFDDSKISYLLNYLNKETYIQGIVELPKELFLNKNSQKSVLIIQKKGKTTQPIKETLLASVPNFKDIEAMKYFINEIEKWKKENKG